MAARYACLRCDTPHDAWAERCRACGNMAVSAVREADPEARALPSEGHPVEALAERSGAVPLRRVPHAEAVDIALAVATPLFEGLAGVKGQVSSTPIPSTEVTEQHLPRNPTGLAPLDLVLGGGLVAGSVVVLGGAPGSGKSSCLAQALRGLGCRALYAIGEETVAQVADRQRRIGALSPRVLLVRETKLEAVLAHAEALRVAVVAIDSIQTLTCGAVEQLAGTAAQVRACADRLVAFAKATNTAVIVTCHVSKDSSLSGPRTLEHLVDVVMMLSPGRGDLRLLSCPSKNRFAQTRVEGRLLLTAAGLVEAPAAGDEPPPAERPESCPHCGLPLDVEGQILS